MSTRRPNRFAAKRLIDIHRGVKNADDFDDVAAIRIEHDMRPAANAAPALAQVRASDAEAGVFERCPERAQQDQRGRSRRP